MQWLYILHYAYWFVQWFLCRLFPLKLLLLVLKGCFEIRKYSFCNIWKRGWAKKMPGILRFVSMLFLIFEKGMCKKTVPGILRFVNILFLIFEKGDE